MEQKGNKKCRTKSWKAPMGLTLLISRPAELPMASSTFLQVAIMERFRHMECFTWGFTFLSYGCSWCVCLVFLGVCEIEQVAIWDVRDRDRPKIATSVENKTPVFSSCLLSEDLTRACYVLANGEVYTLSTTTKKIRKQPEIQTLLSSKNCACRYWSGVPTWVRFAEVCFKFLSYLRVCVFFCCCC